MEVAGEGGEELLNRMARANLPFWGAKRWGTRGWRFRASFLREREVAALAAEMGCETRVIRRGGVTAGAWGLRRRWGFWAGAAVAAALVAVLGQVVLRVEVSGNVTVSTGRILTQLGANGVKVGTFAPGVDTGQVSHGVLLAIPELSWMTVNLKGTVAEVIVREGRARPELLEEDVPAHIEAKYPGIITKIQATSGDAKVKKGDTVAAGDVLIDSWVDFVEPEYFEGDLGGMTVRATGKVWARTWHTLKAAMPLTEKRKLYTGAEKRRVSLEFFGNEVKFYRKGGIPYEEYGKIVTYHGLTLPFGVELPVGFRVEVCREYTLEEGDIDRAEAAEVLEAQLRRQLALLAEDGEIRKTDLQIKEEKGLLTATLLAECEQLIGVTVEDP